MDVVAELECVAPPDVVYEVVVDLGGYPDWLDIVAAVEPSAPVAGDPGPAWSVELRAQVGPLRRAKRLRMVRTQATPGSEVRFERREIDGRRHSPWVLSAGIEPAPGEPSSSRLTMRLHYGGNLWVPVLDRLLAQEIERSRPRLARLLAQHGAAGAAG